MGIKIKGKILRAKEAKNFFTAFSLNIRNLIFLGIFRNEITTILTPSTSEGVSGGGVGGHVFRFEGP